MEWQRVMSLVFMLFAGYVTYLYLTGKLKLGPDGKEWQATDETKVATCPPAECDCALLRARVAYLDRRVADLENALLKAEGLDASLYNKYLELLKERDEWKARALAAEAENEDLKRRLAACQAELAACRAALRELQARCLEQAQKTACSPELSKVGTLLR